jgi:hypothetical protein
MSGLKIKSMLHHYQKSSIHGERR